MLTRPLVRPKNRWKDDIIKDMKKLKIENWTNASRIAVSGNYTLRRLKRPKNEAVAPKVQIRMLTHITPCYVVFFMFVYSFICL
jgi:hypothetical protein